MSEQLAQKQGTDQTHKKAETIDDDASSVKVARWEIPLMEVDPEHVIHFETKEQKEKETTQTEQQYTPSEQQLNEWKQEIRKEIYDKAYSEGHQQGLKAAEQEIATAQAQTDQLQQTLKSLIDHLSSPLEQVNHEVEQQLEMLALSLAQQLVRREIKIDSGQIIGLIRDSIALLPASSRKIKITINPEDSQVIKEALSLDMDDSDMKWRLIEDPMITAGGCIIKSDQSVINATVENRLASLSASVLSGNREADEANTQADNSEQLSKQTEQDVDPEPIVSEVDEPEVQSESQDDLNS